MRRFSYLIIVLLGQLYSCTEPKNQESPKNKSVTITGDLYFKIINLDSYYDVDSLMIKKLTSSLDSLKSIESKDLSKENKGTISLLENIEINKLVERPSFHIRTDSLDEYMVYVNQNDWDKIGDYERQQLINQKKKIKIELTGQLILLSNLKIINCGQINRIEIINGQTY